MFFDRFFPKIKEVFDQINGDIKGGSRVDNFTFMRGKYFSNNGYMTS